MKSRTNRWGLTAAACLAALIVGCQTTPDRLVHDNFRQIQPNISTHEDVRAILGEPDEDLDRAWTYGRPDTHLIVLIDFDEKGRVTRKQWIDGETSYWDDSNAPSSKD